MSLHSSLKIDRASATQRSVQTRIERIKELMKKGFWKEETGVTGLPKTKIVRIKAKKKVKAEEEIAAGDAAAGAAGAAGKPAEEAKAASAKGGSAFGGKTAAGKPAAGPKK